MRKLTVKNFSVIKDAELEFGKITVLIGPQASGKSLLCKLAYFLGKELVDLAVTSVGNRDGWNTYVEYAAREFLQRFNNYSVGDWNPSPHRVTYTSAQYQVALKWGDDPNIVSFEFSNAFQDRYLELLENLYGNLPSASGAFYPGGLNPNFRRGDIWVAFSKILSENVLKQTIYIPAGRAFFTNLTKSFSVLQSSKLDSITKEFAAQIQWDGRWKPGLLTTGRGVTDEINRSMTDIVRGFVIMDSGIPRFITDDGRKLPLEIVSTGVQELVPLFNILEQLMFLREHSFEYSRAKFSPPKSEIPAESKPLIYIEEPEANVFPSTQYDLVRLFSWLSSDPVLDFSWIITTHSPYVLSAFNNLIEAGYVVRKHPELRGGVAKVIPEQYWVRGEDFRAYAIKDGVLESIVASDTRLISENYLDSVSETIGMQFDELLRLGYVTH